ncbi:MAG: FecR family protein [Prolixibacteraceae bacterium]
MKSKLNTDELVNHYRLPSGKSKEQAWNELISRIPKEKPERKIKSRMFAAASVLAAIVLFTILADSFLFVKKHSTNFGEQKAVVLPDDSEVMLAPNSTLKVNYSFLNGERNLDLSGQALFQVEPGRTFSVKFTNGKVTVIGTRFTVRAYDNLQSEIKCLSGSVKLKSDSKELILEKGDGVIIEKDLELKPIHVKEKRTLEEMNGVFFWQNEPLNRIFNVLEARFGYKVRASEKVENRKFTGEINMNGLQSAGEILAFAMELNYSIDHQNQIIAFEEKE